MVTRATGKLRLGPLPRTELTKLTISLPADLKNQLDCYAAAHSELHGENVDAVTLIPHMLHAFVSRDRTFKSIAKRRGVAGAKPQASG